MSISLNKKLFSILLMASYLLVYLIGYLTPMHSDDFGYYELGLSWLAHYQHYIGWSGRFVVDYLVSALLALNKHALIVGVNSLIFVSLIYTVSTLPFYKKPYDYKIICQLYSILFICYWMGNPDLGQTAFWIVGSANYLWPCLFSALFLKYFLRAVHSSEKKSFHYVCLALAFFVGASNEVMSATMVALLGFALIFSFYKKYHNRHWILCCFLLMLFGAALLLLAPGNRVRAAHPLFQDWYALSFSERIYIHLIDRLPKVYKAFSNFAGLYVLVLVLFWRRIRQAECNDQGLVFLFLAGSVMAAISMFAAPAVASRAYLTVMYFLWLSFSSVVSVFLQGKVLAGVRFFNVLTGFLVVVFVMSYAVQLRAYYHAYLQSQIRIDLIKRGVARGEKVMAVPDYYFLKFFGKNQEFDLFHSPDGMGAYYGVEAINVYLVKFDYALINQPCKDELFDQKLDNQVICAWQYQRNPVNASSRTLVLELTPQYGSLVDAKHSAFHLNLRDAKTGKSYTSEAEPVRIGDRVFLSVSGNFSGLDHSTGHSAIRIERKN